MNAGAGSGVVDFFHGLQVALMMTIMLNLTQFVFWRCKQSRRGNCLQVHGPTLYTLLASFLVNVQPLWILIIGSWKLCCGSCVEMGFTTKGPDGKPQPNPDCTSSGRSFGPFGDGLARECTWNGNVFWDDSYCNGSQYAVFPTKATGWVVQILCTWGGFVFMFIGVLQATQLHKKMGKKWRSIRTRNSSARAAAISRATEY